MAHIWFVTVSGPTEHTESGLGAHGHFDLFGVVEVPSLQAASGCKRGRNLSNQFWGTRGQGGSFLRTLFALGCGANLRPALPDTAFVSLSMCVFFFPANG